MGGWACGELVDGTGVCLEACTADGPTSVGFGCVDGAQVACSRAGDAAPCSQCGCPAGEVCPAGGTACQPLAAEGQSCFSNDDCITSSCSVHGGDQAGVCLKAAGAACTPGEATCLSCDVTTSGSVCAQSCGDGDGCTRCIGSEARGYFCRQDCWASRRCPAYWTCEVIDAFNEVAYCEPPDRCDPTASLPCGLTGTCHPDLRICVRNL
jgi:hypothetical protein